MKLQNFLYNEWVTNLADSTPEELELAEKYIIPADAQTKLELEADFNSAVTAAEYRAFFAGMKAIVYVMRELGIGGGYIK